LNTDNDLTKDFSMYNNNLAYSTYTQNNVGVESPEKLVQMMYEGILRFNMQAKRSINEGDIERRTYWINRSNAIFSELINILDFNHGEIAHYLAGLYNYQIHLLLEANLQSNPAKLDEVTRVVKALLDAWRESTNVAE
jgi:flagellar secretion chaperone FliS